MTDTGSDLALLAVASGALDRSALRFFSATQPWNKDLFMMAAVFATNHKGMPMIDSEQQLDFFHRQVMTSRNFCANPVINFWYGGLNYQIEHHLFPTLPRNRLGEAQSIVNIFCAEHDIPYCETGLIQSYREMLQFFRAITMVLREPTSEPQAAS